MRRLIATIQEQPARKVLEEKRLSASYCTYDEISISLKNAVLSIEDSLFFQHPGFTLRCYFRAMVENLKRGKIVRGGSTITLQLAKNLYLTQERTMRRKILELFAAIYLEHALSKEEIIELYLNIVDFGNEQYGIRNACHYYFQIEPAALTLNQALSLTCLLPNPNWHNPNTPEGRSHLYFWRDWALSELHRRQLLTESELNYLRCIPWDAAFSGSNDEQRYGSFVTGTSPKAYWEKLKQKCGILLWKRKVAQARRRVPKPGRGGSLYLIFTDSSSSNTLALLDLLDRCGVKACFCLNGVLKDARREEIQKRGHRILEGDYPRKNQAVVCSSYEIANRPESVFRQVFSEITQQRKTEIVIQDIWRNDNTLVEGIVLEGLQKGYSFELVSRDFCLVEP